MRVLVHRCGKVNGRGKCFTSWSISVFESLECALLCAKCVFGLDLEFVGFSVILLFEMIPEPIQREQGGM